MQPRRRRGDGTSVLGEHGLVARLIGLVSGARDVRRQRNLATRVDHRVDVAPKFEAIQIAAAFDHRRGLIERIEQHDASRFQRFADAHLAQRATIALDPFDQQLGRAARILASVQTRANDTRVVQNEQIRRRQQFGQVSEALVRDRVGFRIEHHQSTVGAIVQRLLRDQMFRQAISEVASCEGHWLDRPMKNAASLREVFRATPGAAPVD